MSVTTEVTETVFEQYEAVRIAGPCNMVDKSCVQRTANEMGLYELVVFIDEGDYFELLQNYGDYSEEYDG